MRETAPVGHFLSPNESSSTGTGLHSIELLAKVVPWKPPTTQAVAEMIDYSSQTDSKAQVLKETPTQLTEPREVEQVPT